MDYEELDENIDEPLSDDEIEYLKEIFSSITPDEKITMVDRGKLELITRETQKIERFVRKSCCDKFDLPKIKVDFFEFVETDMYMEIVVSGRGLKFTVEQLADAINETPPDCLIEIYPRVDEKYTICITFENVKNVLHETPVDPPDWVKDIFGL